MSISDINLLFNGIAEQLHEDSRMEIVIENGYAGVILYHDNEKIGDYSISESLPTMDMLIEYVVGREKHLHKGE